MEGETDTFIPSTNPITQTSYLSDDHEYAKSRSDSDQRSEFLPEKEIAGSGSHRLETMMSTKYKVFRTLCIILGHVGMGLSLELAGPTLQDMMMRVGANYEEISRGLSTKMVGVMVTAPLTGILTDVFDQHVEIILAVGYLVSVVGTAVLPWCGSLSIYVAFSVIQGLSAGIVDVCHNFLILRIWGEKAGPPMYALHVGFGLGALMAPQLAKPFITGNNPSATTTYNVTDIGNTSFVIPSLPTSASNSTTSAIFPEEVAGVSRIEIPYSIAAAFALLLVPLVICIYIYEKCTFKTSDKHLMESALSPSSEKRQTFKQRCLKGLNIFSPGSCTGGKTSLGVVFFILFFLFYLNIVGGERSYHTLLFSYAVDGPFSFSKDKAANLNSVFWFSFLAGRTLSVFVSIKVPAYIFMFILVSMTGVSGLLLLVFGASNELIFWIATGMYAFFMSPLYPACGAWANQHVEMKGIATALMTIGAGTGATLYHWIAGYLFEYQGPYSLMKVLFANCIIVWFSFLALFLVALRLGKRFTGTSEVTGSVEMKPIRK